MGLNAQRIPKIELHSQKKKIEKEKSIMQQITKRVSSFKNKFRIQIIDHKKLINAALW